ncbi:MAG: tRNA uridine-5-carboxymethylaminomethyl(34) synthesis GTPase MnmE [Acidobacteria bacterium RIFCSPLOWO2_02_FULL_59_13]|nr:MAG: tRNA uridine-5-carboxymethylaminomethyl(34) synthesis GTPase MnmE [Acidobacteria bacterium RIFCSPLOWO2_02_FULL_59_13]
MNTDDTIVAISTPRGRGGLGVVRLSGNKALLIAEQLLRRAPPKQPADTQDNGLDLRPWRVRSAALTDEEGGLMDRVLVSWFRKPRSYTGEDVVEISAHGSPVILEFLLGRCIAVGARLAEPGEFTLRAFLNGRMDLTQAEAVHDLIEAQTLYQAKVAAQQVEGAVSHRISPFKKQLVDLIALLEAGIDFAEDDVSVLSTAEISGRLAPIEEGLSQMAQSFRAGKIIRQGLVLAIVGRPNVGKSSLFNCLLQQDRAIVTATPGTTRDLVSETIELEGIPLRFVDTAGIRHAFEEAESIGVRKSYEAAVDSDLALLVLDGSQDMTAEDRDLLARLSGLGKLVVVVNKCDLSLRLGPENLQQELAQTGPTATASNCSASILFVSALKREGIEKLRQTILETAAPALAGHRETQLLTNIRQERLVRESQAALADAQESLRAGVPHEMVLLDLYNSLRPLDAITGETTVEDILTHIFSTFCIGK